LADGPGVEAAAEVEQGAAGAGGVERGEFEAGEAGELVGLRVEAEDGVGGEAVVGGGSTGVAASWTAMKRRRPESEKARALGPSPTGPRDIQGTRAWISARVMVRVTEPRMSMMVTWSVARSAAALRPERGAEARASRGPVPTAVSGVDTGAAVAEATVSARRASTALEGCIARIMFIPF